MDNIQVVAFRLGESTFAVDIMKVKEILKTQPVTKLPVSDLSLLGVIKVRGKIVPVVDSRAKLGIENTDMTDNSRLLLVEKAGTTVGMLVDEVTEVMTINQEQIEKAEDIGVSIENTGCIVGVAKIEDKLMTFLDTDLLL
ncbi:MAG: purine-binding chemotaxis protein CheW [Syntrophomonadaceae bacterium]|jgi:purine-binding chemotaxis protein CheW|nr:purine-binding chemotaxis protein CheW [Syntrophomonadaceae bacterium]